MKGSWYETKLQRHCQHLSSDVGKFLLGAWVCLVFVGLWLARSGAERVDVPMGKHVQVVFLGVRGGLGGKAAKVHFQMCHRVDVSDTRATCYSRSQASIGLGLYEGTACHAPCPHEDAVPTLPLRQTALSLSFPSLCPLFSLVCHVGGRCDICLQLRG